MLRHQVPGARSIGSGRLRQVLGHDARTPRLRARGAPPGGRSGDMMRARPAPERAALPPARRATNPPVSQPIFRMHPITGRTVLYCNPGYATRIDGLPEAESDELLEHLFMHPEQEDSV